MQVEVGEIVTVLGALTAGAGGVLALAWKWFTGLVDRLQSERTADLKTFTVEVSTARTQCVEENKTARREFLEGLRDLETRREKTDEKVTQSLAGIEAILRERGIPAPRTTGAPS